MTIPDHRSLMQGEPKKRKFNERQELILDAFCSPGSATYGDATASGELAGYKSPESSRAVLMNLKDEVIERMKTVLALRTVKSVGVLNETLEGNWDHSVEKQKLIVSTAQDILDRSGVSKRTEVDVNSKQLVAVVILPAKDATSELQNIFTPKESEAILDLQPVEDTQEYHYIDQSSN